ncbi:peptidoglycan DD-metalloendopeptidase family protein [Bacillota bacterium LX-D]|nr:peptidoglycan DD-metalloendopeptidase family protein [Bacillota bacterium LX-D]
MENKKRLGKRPQMLIGAILGLLAVVFAIGIFGFNHKANAFGVFIDGKQVAFVKNKEVAQNYLNKLQSEQKDFAEVDFKEKITFQQMQVKPESLTPEDQLEEILRTKLTPMVQGTVVLVQGKAIGAVANEATAKDVLEQVKKHYLPQDPKLKLKGIKFEEAIALKSQKVPVKEITSPEKLQSLLINGTSQPKSYTVQAGDTIWTIAAANGMSLEEMHSANPWLSSDKLDIGQKIQLVKTEPLVHVVYAANYKVTKRIPFEIKQVTDKKLLRGKQKVTQWGASGQKEIEYQIVKRNGKQVKQQKITVYVVKKPITQVVAKGTKMVLASRGDSRKGILSWPHRGAITSPYGNRGGEFHTGVDINGNTGDPVYAAEAGTVIFAGWSGNYGNMVAISHGDGLVTRYAHNSKLEVSVGERVARGQLISRIGSTGRSTGSHLHFEVLAKGSSRNPLRYLN